MLKIACPDIEWNEEDIVRTHRVGYKSEAEDINDNNDGDDVKQRTLLIKFLHWDKKMKVLKGREALREVGIRVGGDLTRRQRKTLQDLSACGTYGYYYWGELIVKDAKPAGNSRVFRRAQRKINDGANQGLSMDGVEPGEIDGRSTAEIASGMTGAYGYINNIK